MTRPSFVMRPALVRHNIEYDPLALDRSLTKQNCLFILYTDDKAVLRTGDPPCSLLNHHDFEMPSDHLEQILLGEYHEAPVIATLLPKEKATVFTSNPDFQLIDLRTLAANAVLPEEEMGLLATAKSLLSWHVRHRFCSHCGHSTHVVANGFRRDCPSCTVQHFPRTDPVVIMLITHGERCLLGRSPNFERFSCLAGFMEPGETIEAAVRRETYEEAGIHVGEVRYISSQPWPFPSSLMIGMHGLANNDDIVIDKQELVEARWFNKADIQQMFDGCHPEGLIPPPPFAIAHHLMRQFLKS